MKRNGTERKYDVNGLDRCLVSFVPAPFIGSSGGGIAQVVHRSAVEQVVTLTALVDMITNTIFSNCPRVFKIGVVRQLNMHCKHQNTF